jgi:hypothetical protein
MVVESFTFKSGYISVCLKAWMFFSIVFGIRDANKSEVSV